MKNAPRSAKAAGYTLDAAAHDEFERQLLTSVLARCGDNRAAAARILGISYATLKYRLAKLKRSPRLAVTSGDSALIEEACRLALGPVRGPEHSQARTAIVDILAKLLAAVRNVAADALKSELRGVIG